MTSPAVRHGSEPSSPDFGSVQEATGLLLSVVALIERNFAAHAATAGLSAVQAKLLLLLHPSELLSLRELAARLGYDPSNFTGLVDRLEVRGLVRRQPSPQDRRAKALALTEEGGRVRDAVWARVVNDPGPLAHLTGDEVVQLRDLLDRALRPSGLDPVALLWGPR